MQHAAVEYRMHRILDSRYTLETRQSLSLKVYLSN